MAEPDLENAEYIEKSIRSLKQSENDRTFDERMIRAPVGVLEPKTPIVVGPQTPILEAVALMQKERVGCVLVTRASKLKGIFTERDVLTAVVGKAVDPLKTPVRKLMTPNPEYLRITD
jgi:CBS domain-containing protein